MKHRGLSPALRHRCESVRLLFVLFCFSHLPIYISCRLLWRLPQKILASHNLVVQPHCKYQLISGDAYKFVISKSPIDSAFDHAPVPSINCLFFHFPTIPPSNNHCGPKDNATQALNISRVIQRIRNLIST